MKTRRLQINLYNQTINSPSHSCERCRLATDWLQTYKSLGQISIGHGSIAAEETSDREHAHPQKLPVSTKILNLNIICYHITAVEIVIPYLLYIIRKYIKQEVRNSVIK